jgi:hypothetical protein
VAVIVMVPVAPTIVMPPFAVVSVKSAVVEL